LNNQPLPTSSAEGLLEALAQRVAELVLAGLPDLQPQAEPQQWFSVAQAAVYCGVSEDAIRAATKSKQLRKHTRGKVSIALHRADLDRWMRGGS
jgi:excisionase family DNA binding protein